MDHTDDVLCIDRHPTRSLVASGQKGRLPKVRAGQIRVARFCESSRAIDLYGLATAQGVCAPILNYSNLRRELGVDLGRFPQTFAESVVAV